jgi:hypothetical protein
LLKLLPSHSRVKKELALYSCEKKKRYGLPSNHCGNDGGNHQDQSGNHSLGGDQRDLDTAAAPREVEDVAWNTDKTNRGKSFGIFC